MSVSKKDKFISQRAQGKSYQSIADELGVSRQTLQNWAKDLETELANAKAFQIDSIRAKYNMLRVHQVESFGQVLSKITEVSLLKFPDTQIR